MRDSYTLLASTRRTLADLLRRVEAGDTGALGDLATKQAELETALKRAFDAEMKHNEWLAKQGADTAPEGEIDFDALRHDISCRLERLRACCQEP